METQYVPGVGIESWQNGSEEPAPPYEDADTPKPIKFKLTRTGPTTSSYIVRLKNYTGSATPGVDYVYSQSFVMFAVGETEAELVIRPIWDDVHESTETVEVTIDAPENQQQVNLVLGSGETNLAAGPALTEPAPATAKADIADEFWDAVKPKIAASEGERDTAYKDTKGNWTVGIGHNLGPDGITQGKDDFETATGLNYDQVKAGTVSLTHAQIASLFKIDLQKAVTQAKADVSNFADQPLAVKVVIVDLIFNLGSLTNFPSFKADIVAKNYRQGAWDLSHKIAQPDSLPSKYMGDVGTRATNNVAVLNKVADEHKEPKLFAGTQNEWPA